ncbi:MAG: hypothetical protein ACFB2Z_04935 [Maricaulaceae bacterium]
MRAFSRSLVRLAAAIAVAATAAPAFAEVLESEIEGEVRERVELPDDLKAMSPALYGEIKAKALAAIDEFRETSIAERRALREAGEPPAKPWLLETQWVVRFANPQIISIVEQSVAFSGGAQGEAFYNAWFYDPRARDTVAVSDMLNGIEDNGPTVVALAGAARSALKDAKYKRTKTTLEDEDLVGLIADDEAALGQIVLAPSTAPCRASGFVFLYAPFELGPFPEGAYELVIPWSAFARALTPKWSGLFAGVAPEPAGEAG